MKRSFLIVLSVVLFVCGCGSTKKVISVAIAPSAQAKIDAGQTLSFSATLANDSHSKGVSWTMSGTGCTGSACGTFTGSTSTGITYVAPKTVSSSMTVSIQATSVADTTKTASATVVVSPTPSISTTTLAGGTVATAYSATLAATGGSGALTWALASGSSLPAGLSLTNAGTISGTPTTAGATSFTVKVTDASGGHEGPVSATQQLSLTIKPAQLVIATTSLSNGVAGAAYSASLAASGGTGTIGWSLTTGTLPAGLSLSGSMISGTPTAAGTSVFTVTATDSGSPAQTVNQSLSITINPKLAITTTALSNGVVGTAYSTSLASSGGVGTITWSVATGTLPVGLTLGAAGVISGTPTTAGSSNFTVQAKDSGTPQQSAQQALSVTIYAGLTITTTSLPNGTMNSTYSATLASAGGTGNVTWSISQGSMPAGLTLSNSGAISGTPTASGPFNFTVSATDSSSPPQTKTQALIITISPALSITTTSLPAGTVGTAYSQNIETSGGTLPISWSVTTGSLPAGLALAGNSMGVGVISGAPTAPGSSTFTVTAKDSSTPQVSVNQQFTLAINAPPLAITTTTLPNGTVNAAYSAPLQASGGTPPYAWTVATGSTLPNWLTLGGSGTNWTLSGTPTTAAIAAFSLTVSDSSVPSQSQTQALTLTVASASACGTGNESALKGQYAFGMTGRTGDGFFAVVGSFTADGIGNITAGYVDANGEQDLGNGLGVQSGTITPSGSSYTMGTDNRGCATIVTPFYTFITRFAIPPSTSGFAQGVIQEAEPTGWEVFAGSGQIFQQQVPTAVPTGNWVHAQIGAIGTSQYESGVIASGVDVYGSGGVITNGEYDYKSYGILTKQSGLTGTYTAPDPTTGRYTLTTTANLGTLGPKSLNRAAYLLSPTHILEVTTSAGTILAGDLKLQSGSLTLSGNLAMYGTSTNSYGTTSDMAGFGLVNATGTSYTGKIYQNVTGKWTTPSPVPTTCSYTIDSFGRVATSGTNCGGYYNSTTSAWVEPPVIYLTGSNTGFLAGSDGIWKVAPQSATTITAGSYYLGTPQPDIVWGTGWDTVSGIAQVTSNSITGSEDKSRLPNENFSQTLTLNADGTFSTSDNPGVVTGLVISPSQLIELQDPTALWPSIVVINAVK
ncbi:putative Ig domain-containing protein [Telmatobacter sp. DSM 110680]|uniref:Ig domain-containing protein n=1 Tax=Telmatobacter sp. DSM 110680 TaxID=3036704 RepID=A0AAU7DFK0_9BACT